MHHPAQHTPVVKLQLVLLVVHMRLKGADGLAAEDAVQGLHPHKTGATCEVMGTGAAATQGLPLPSKAKAFFLGWNTQAQMPQAGYSQQGISTQQMHVQLLAFHEMNSAMQRRVCAPTSVCAGPRRQGPRFANLVVLSGGAGAGRLVLPNEAEAVRGRIEAAGCCAAT